MDKVFVTEEEQMLDAFRLGVQVFESGFRPTFIVGIWRGGASVGIVVQECLQTLGVDADHIAVRTSRRQGAGADAFIRVHGTQYLLENMNSDDALLIVDDAYSTGRNVRAVIDRLRTRTKRNMPEDVRVAAIWYRPEGGPNPPPDYFLHETRAHIEFPWELDGLTEAEIAEHRSFLLPLLAEDAPEG